jgi:UDP-N-acetylmuramyl pentapeptide phosphotransferase/UDP-N-acetylglucosamine-1-phosphate transferase
LFYLDSLGTVLALSIGLGIPAALGIVGSFIYLFKLIKKRKTQVLPFKQTEIQLKKRHHHHHHHRHDKRTQKKRKEFL